MKHFKWFFIILFNIGLQAQEIEVKGLVKDIHQLPLIGVSITIKNTIKGTTTDFDGKFSISVKPDDVLVFSFLGMKTLEQKITSKNTQLNIILQSDIQELSQTVVIGYGSRKNITAVSGSVSQIEMADYANAPSANALDALQGKVAGLQITSTTGEPGQTSNIVLHGQGNIKGFFEGFNVSTSPLFVVDGTPVSGEVALTLNPSDFENITVLKDASATSIYGARASNGVIYITTKKGKLGQKSIITFNTQLGFSNLHNRNYYKQLMNSQEYMNFWIDRGAITPAQAQNILEQYPHNTRWDEFYFKKDVPTTQSNLSISGGGQAVSYYLSAGHFKQNGIMYRSGFERYTLNANIDANIKKWLKVGINMMVGHHQNATAYGTGSGDSPLLTLPIYSFTGENNERKDYIEEILALGKRTYNPEYLADKNPSEVQSQEVIPIGYISIEPINNLVIKTQGGMQYSVSEYQNKTLASSHLTPQTSISNDKHLSKTITNTLEYHSDWNDKHHFTLLLGQESIFDANYGFSATSQGQTSDRKSMLKHGTNNKEVDDYKSISTYNSYFSKLDYNFLNRYFLDISFRRDGSSNFGKNNRYANFWALGLLWRAKFEPFLQKLEWLDLLNLRLSTGISGNANVGAYSHLTLINADLRYNDQTGYTIERLGNPSLQWEKQRKTNLGLSIGVFKSLSLEIDLYNRTTHDMLFDQTLPSMTGFFSYIKNVAEMQNRGIDVTFSLTAYHQQEKNISIKPYINFNYNQQKVLKVYEDASKNPIQSIFGMMIKEGEPITYALPIFKSVNPQTGAPEWYLPSQDPTILHTDDNQVSSVFNMEQLIQNTNKKVQAPLTGGFGLSASYKQLALQMGFSFSQGKYMRFRDRLTMDNPTQFGQRNLSKKAANYWKQIGDQAEFPALQYRAIMPDSRLLEDASFIRLKDISLSYTLPKWAIQQIGFFQSIKLYAQGRNLLTFTSFKGIDPEFEVLANQGGYPSSEQYSFGFEVKF